MDGTKRWSLISPRELAPLVTSVDSKRLVIDSRSFLEFNTCHIRGALNVPFSKLIKRNLQNDQLHVKQLLSLSYRQLNFDLDYDIIVYDQCTSRPDLLSEDCFLFVFMEKLVSEFKDVKFLTGGLIDFQAEFHTLCETEKSSMSSSSSSLASRQKCVISLSQPCLSPSAVGPTRILPFFFLGSQQDAVSQETMKENGISYVLNVSTNGEEPNFLGEGHFFRIPVNDSHNDKLLPHFSSAFQFIDKVREADECVLVHCLAGISRSPTLAIAYLMKYFGLTCDEAYKYVKDKRPSISPNFNFLGQLLEYEKQLKQMAGSGFLPIPLFKPESVADELPALDFFRSQTTRSDGRLRVSRERFSSLHEYKAAGLGAGEIRASVGEEFSVSDFELKVKVEQSIICAVEGAVTLSKLAGTSSVSVPLKTHPLRPSSLLQSPTKSLSKLNFESNPPTTSNNLEPPPDLEVPLPEEKTILQNVCAQSNSTHRPEINKEQQIVSSHSDIISSSSLMPKHTPDNGPNDSLSCSSGASRITDLKTQSNCGKNSYWKEEGSIQHHHSHHPSKNLYSSQKLYSGHLTNRGHQRGFSHRNNQHSRMHQQRNNRKIYLSKCHSEYQPNYRLFSLQHPFYGFYPPPPCNFPSVGFPHPLTHQCFPYFHSLQPPPMYFHHPTSSHLGSLCLPNFGYFSGHHYQEKNNFHNYPVNFYGSHRQRHQRHSYFPSNNNNFSYHNFLFGEKNFPTSGNFVVKEDSGNNKSLSFTDKSFSTVDPQFYPVTQKYTSAAMPPDLESGSRSSRSGRRPDSNVLNKNSAESSNNHDQKCSQNHFQNSCTAPDLAGDKNDIDLQDRDDASVSTKSSKEIARVDIIDHNSKNSAKISCDPLLSPASTRTATSKESNIGTGKPPPGFKKASPRSRPNNITLQNIKVRSGLTLDLVGSNSLRPSQDAPGPFQVGKRVVRKQSDSEFKTQTDEISKTKDDIDEELGDAAVKSGANEVELLPNKSIGDGFRFHHYPNGHPGMLGMVVREVHSLTDENETWCPSMFSLTSKNKCRTDSPAGHISPETNVGGEEAGKPTSKPRESFLSSTSSSSSSSSSSRKSRSLEDMLVSLRSVGSDTDARIRAERCNKSLPNKMCACQSDRKHSPVFPTNHKCSSVNPKKRLKLLDMLNAGHEWQPGNDLERSAVMTPHGSAQSSLHGSIEVVKVS